MILANAAEAFAGLAALVSVLLLLGSMLFFMIRLEAKAERRWREKHAISDKFIIAGKYLTGLPGLHRPAKHLLCGSSTAAFKFGGGDPSGNRMRPKTLAAEIQYSQIHAIELDDRSAIEAKITVPRILALGLFALVAKAKVRSGDLVLLIDWTDEVGERHNTLFEFAGGENARDQAYACWNWFNATWNQQRANMQLELDGPRLAPTVG